MFVLRYYWSHLGDAPDIKVASDTQDDRDPTQIWLTIGIVATSSMAFTYYVGWWYQRLVRKRFIMTVEEMYRCGNDENTVETKVDNMGPSDDHGTDAPPLSVMGNGEPLEEADHEDISLDASRPVRSMAPTAEAHIFHIARKPVGEIQNKIGTIGPE